MKESNKLSILPERPKYNIDEHLILSKNTYLSLQECIAKLKFHKKIYEEWDFKSVDPNGSSLIINFYGEPGTGKTLAAESFAGTLGRPIIKIGIADIESKYMGDSAKNIQSVFELANEEQAVLFFDEADTMLGKRLSNVTQGTDNEVNSVRTTLLIELEKFDGIVIFATNFIKNYDSAFISRIGYQIEFELPDFGARKLLWNKFLVPKIPLDGVRENIIEELASNSENFSGRDIRKCLRISLPKVFQRQDSEFKINRDILMASLFEVKSAKNLQEVRRRKVNDDSSIDKAVSILGIKQDKNEETN
ncbi:ATP-binding protein [Vibrio sp. 1733]|uniref:ATP-binding protein n=1 Tax=unclassified Vibrio TaxID=2614977 RepID=UPI002965210E|nr:MULTISPECIES: ATP-binding protein [unclassified Vibrio]MDW2187689.1 ATP-binding protein [Vibrio sp. 1733]MDW2238609.1 ATP-binding protein [Vibrio sp. 1565-1]